jgi:Cu-Zn family superoxide dismutase
MSVLINKFTVNEIIGRTVIIHSQPDDFTTQPSGNSGKKIACGEIIEQ